jgi:DNA-binding NtrC family response regulator
MLHRTRVKVDAIRAIVRDCTREERDQILAIVARGEDVAPATIDRAAIERALASSNGHVGLAADALAVGRRTLQKKMREYGMPAGAAGRKSRFV